MNMDYLKEFKEMNVTFDSVFDLEETGLLIILKDGTNLTSWDDVGDYDDVLYLSQDFSCCDENFKYRRCKNVQVMVLQNPYFHGFLGVSISFSHMTSLKALYAIDWNMSFVTSMNNMFSNCYSLEYIYGIENWDTSNVKSFWGTFADCYSLKTLNGIENWDLSSAVNMESMFEKCIGLEDISAISDWDMSNVENIFEIFRDCYSLKDASCLNWSFKNLKKGGNMFINCYNLKELPKWHDDEFKARFTINGELEKMDENAIYEKIKKGEFSEQDIFVAVSYIEDEDLLKNLISDFSLHYYTKRAVLLNPNFTDSELLEYNALNSYEPVERSYALENPNFRNVKLLKRIAKEDKSYSVRYMAERKLKKMIYDKYDEITEN